MLVAKPSNASRKKQRSNDNEQHHQQGGIMHTEGLEGLPDEILVHICRLLPVAALGSLAVTCSRLRAVTRTDDVWKDITTCLFASNVSMARCGSLFVSCL